jgi:hypothetical protein
MSRTPNLQVVIKKTPDVPVWFGYATLMLARVDAMCVSPATQPLDVASMKTRATQQKKMDLQIMINKSPNTLGQNLVTLCIRMQQIWHE